MAVDPRAVRDPGQAAYEDYETTHGVMPYLNPPFTRDPYTDPRITGARPIPRVWMYRPSIREFRQMRRTPRR
jgi:hypothetical protein